MNDGERRIWMNMAQRKRDINKKRLNKRERERGVMMMGNR